MNTPNVPVMKFFRSTTQEVKPHIWKENGKHYCACGHRMGFKCSGDTAEEAYRNYIQFEREVDDGLHQ